MCFQAITPDVLLRPRRQQTALGFSVRWDWPGGLRSWAAGTLSSPSLHAQPVLSPASLGLRAPLCAFPHTWPPCASSSPTPASPFGLDTETCPPRRPPLHHPLVPDRPQQVRPCSLAKCFFLCNSQVCQCSQGKEFHADCQRSVP